MKETLLKGLGFGLTSGVITTLGVIVGLHAGTHSRLAVLAGMLVLAVADALSDAIGIHISEEVEGEHATKEVWEATLFAFSSKFGFTLTFVPPILFLEELSLAILVSIVWGLFLIVLLSLYTAKLQNKNVHRAVAEHLIVTVMVIIFAQYIGNLIHGVFGVAAS
jgi:VIT1/CCC1 family predicted Fe2+/Mn2+ transporter